MLWNAKNVNHQCGCQNLSFLARVVTTADAPYSSGKVLYFLKRCPTNKPKAETSFDISRPRHKSFTRYAII